jgi:DNA-binding NtrC family response regulator
MSRILILDDDPDFLAKAKEALAGRFDVSVALSEEDFSRMYRPFFFDLILLDMRLRRDREGIDVLRAIYAQDDLQPVIMCSAYGDAESAVAAVGAGALMFLRKQEFPPAMLGRMVTAVVEQGRWRRRAASLRRMAWRDEPDALLGDGAAMREAAERLREIIASPEAIPLIVGEHGVGRTLAATLIHRHGGRGDGPFFETDAARLREAGNFFTGKRSPWAMAATGTLAVDGLEKLSAVESLPLIERLRGEAGENEPAVALQMAVPVGGVALAPPPWLEALEPMLLLLPPLRERREDVALLANYFLQARRISGRTTARNFSAGALEQLERREWPGNVRELRDVVERAALAAATNKARMVEERHLPFLESALGHPAQGAVEHWDFRFNLARAEVGLIERAIGERGLSRKSELWESLGYSDRFMLGRRVKKALAEFPALTGEFPAVAALFLLKGEKKWFSPKTGG